MAQAKSGDTVRVHYTGKFEDGTVFDSSVGHEPLKFTLGGGTVITAVESGIEGMAPGESKTLNIPCDKAYGQRHSELVQRVEINQLPKELKPEVGMPLELKLKDGHTISFVITSITDDGVILDGNHPLAGEDLTFDIELLEIV
jgi:peptidylprolyl isomerase